MGEKEIFLLKSKLRLKNLYFVLFIFFTLTSFEALSNSLSEKTIHIDKYKRIYLKGGSQFFLRISNSNDDDAASIPLFNLDGKIESMNLKIKVLTTLVISIKKIRDLIEKIILKLFWIKHLLKIVGFLQNHQDLEDPEEPFLEVLLELI